MGIYRGDRDIGRAGGGSVVRERERERERGDRDIGGAGGDPFDIICTCIYIYIIYMYW